MRPPTSAVVTVNEPQAVAAEGTVSPARHWLRLLRRVVATTFDVGLLVVGTALVSLAIVVLLDGFEVVDVGLTTSTGEMLGSGLVIAVFGAFAMGVAVEGPIRKLRRYTGTELEMTFLRAASLLVVGGVLLFAGNALKRLVEELPHTFGIGAEILVVTGIAGLTFTFVVGVAAQWGLWRFFSQRPQLDLLELPVLYAIWLVGALLVFSIRF